MSSSGVAAGEACVAAVFSPCLLLIIPLVVIVLALLWRKRRVDKLLNHNNQRLLSAGHVPDGRLKAFHHLSVHAMSMPEGKKRPFKKGFVLIGGFGDTPMLWEELSQYITKAGHFYVTPRTPGWARDDGFREISLVGWREWVLRAKEALAVAKGICEEVTICGHSTGAVVAALVAETEEVERIVFTGPNLVCNPSDMWARNLLLKPYLGTFIAWFLWVTPKKQRAGRPVDTLNSAVYEKGYYLTAFPMRAVQSMWKAQDAMSGEWRVRKEVVLLMGEQDGSVAPLETQVATARDFIPGGGRVDEKNGGGDGDGNGGTRGVALRFEKVKNAAHGLLSETPDVVEYVARVLLEER